MIERVLAPNPGPMTGSGTNTYLVDNGAGDLAVIDPGPDDPRHLQAILKPPRGAGPIQAVLVTHRHGDHLPAAVPLCRQTGAPLVGHADLPGVQRAVADGEVAFGSLRALATPGHTRESLCFWDPADGRPVHRRPGGRRRHGRPRRPAGCAGGLPWLARAAAGAGAAHDLPGPRAGRRRRARPN